MDWFSAQGGISRISERHQQLEGTELEYYVAEHGQRTSVAE